jgi:hypothetical protein
MVSSTHPLSAVRDSLSNKFAAILHNWRTSPPSTTRGRAILLYQVPTQHAMITTFYQLIIVFSSSHTRIKKLKTKQINSESYKIINS